MKYNKNTFIERLRKRYPNSDTRNFNVLDFVGAFGSPFDALLYAHLFWPEFIEVEGMILRKEMVEDAEDIVKVKEAIQRFEGDRRKVERSYNLVEIPSGIFSQRIEDTSDVEDHQLACILAGMWKARLQQLYPERTFEMIILMPDETGGEIAVTFCQEDRIRIGEGKLE